MENKDCLTEKERKWIDKLNRYAKKVEQINKAQCYETDKEVAESIAKIKKDGNQKSKIKFEVKNNEQDLSM